MALTQMPSRDFRQMQRYPPLMARAFTSTRSPAFSRILLDVTRTPPKIFHVGQAVCEPVHIGQRFLVLLLSGRRRAAAPTRN
jgi:hypothetical protein